MRGANWSSSFAGAWSSSAGTGFGATHRRVQTHAIALARASTQYLRITDAAQNGALDIVGSITIETWIKRASSGTTQYLGSKRGGLGQFGWRWQINGVDTLQIDLSATGLLEVTAVVLAPDWAPTVGVWTQLAMVFTAGAPQTVQFYQDGAAIGLPTVVGIGGLFNNAADFVIGTFGASSFDGYMADFRVWNVARSAAEIAANFDKDINPATPGLAGLWLKDNALVAGNAKDWTSNTNHLELVNGPTFVTESPR